MVVDFGYAFKYNTGAANMLNMNAMTQVREAREEEIAAGKDALLERIKAATAKAKAAAGGGCCVVM